MKLSKFIYINTAVLFIIAAFLSIQNPISVSKKADALSFVKAPPTTPTPPSPTATQLTVDLSKVDWTALARLVYGKCGEYYNLAIQAGWPTSQWPTLSKVMYRESRCNTMSFNRSDPNGGSRGLIQINGYWCKKSRWSNNGWLQDRSILRTCDDLFDPLTNLKAGWAMWQYSQTANGCGWRPWATRCS
jgi:hypothetical protein